MYKLISGDTFRLPLSDLKISFVNKIEYILTNKKGIILSGNIENNVILIKNTESLLSGKYDLYIKETDSEGNVKSHFLDYVSVTGNVYSVSLSDNEKMVKAIQDCLHNRVKQEYISYTINGRSITKFSPKELIDLLKYYQSEVYNEKYAALSKEQKAKQGLLLVNYVENEFL